MIFFHFIVLFFSSEIYCSVKYFLLQYDYVLLNQHVEHVVVFLSSFSSVFRALAGNA